MTLDSFKTMTAADRETYESNVTLAAAADLLRNAQKRIIIVTHGKPDGDAFGSAIALRNALQQLGKDCQAVFVPPIPTPFLDLACATDIRQFREGEDLKSPDLVVMIDTGAWSQIGPMRAAIEPLTDRMLIVDHHLSGDVPAAYKYIDGRAAAACEIAAELIDELGVTFDDRISEALFVGIASDTGWFKFSNTRPQTHQLAARLQANGVDHAALYQALEQGERPQKLALMQRALQNTELVADGRAAIITLRAADFAETGAVLEETERFVDIPQIVHDVEVVALLTEPPGCEAYWSNGDNPDERRSANRCATRISFRSKPGDGAINVADLAAQFQGGGHARAAGAKVNAGVDETREQVRQAIDACFANQSRG